MGEVVCLAATLELKKNRCAEAEGSELARTRRSEVVKSMALLIRGKAGQ